jgi:transcription initiation factor TFIIB
MVSIEFDDPIWLAFGSLSVEPQVPTCRHCGVSGEKTCLLEGAMVCTACHSVVGRQIDYGAEWRYYGAEDLRSCNPTRCCPPMTTTLTKKNAHEVQVQLLGSIVSRGPRRNASQWYRKTEAMTTAAADRVETGRQVQRYQIWNTLSYRDRVLGSVFDTLSITMTHHCLPNIIIEEAKNLYQRVTSMRITRGANRKGVIAACAFVACKRCGVPRSLREIADMFDIDRGVTTRACRLVDEVVDDRSTVNSEPTDFVGRFCSKLQLPPGMREEVCEAVRHIDRECIICDAMPTSIVAGTIAFVTAHYKDVAIRSRKNAGPPSLPPSVAVLPTNDDISKVCQVAITTISKIVKRLQPHREALLKLLPPLPTLPPPSDKPVPPSDKPSLLKPKPRSRRLKATT